MKSTGCKTDVKEHGGLQKMRPTLENISSAGLTCINDTGIN